MINLNKNSRTKWLILAMGTLTNAIVVAVPSMGLSVLFPEISADLNLDLVQAGMVWGASSLPLIISSLAAGSLNDRFGPKRVMILSCLLIGLAGSLRGLATDFLFLAAAVFLASLFFPVVTISNLKNARIWFSNRELGFASGMLSLGMALGFFAGSLVSASILSPWLGGWRNVFFFFSILSIVFTVPWFFIPSIPLDLQQGDTEQPTSFSQSIGHVMKLKDVWLLGTGALGISGGIQGLLGYLPLYLSRLGWSGSSAGGVMASFHTASMLVVLPISLWSDRLGSRKKLAVGAVFLIAAGTGLLSIVRDGGIWGSVIMAGLLRDGFMALFLAMVIESQGVGYRYTGTATGFVMVLFGVGNLGAPPLGNSLAALGEGIPFLFWSAIVIVGGLLIALSKEGGTHLKVTRNNEEELK